MASNIAIYSLLGSKVLGSRIDVSKLSGIYLVNIITKEKVLTKIIVIK